jgi:SAM-dependent methyltransferase
MAPDWWQSFFDGPWQEGQLRGYPQDQTSREVDFILDSLRPESGARILDMPCGEGRHSIELASRGFGVVGVDFKADTVAVARERAAQRGVEVEFRVGDMREFSDSESFACAICFGGSFGYFDEEGDAKVVHGVSRSLQPGGALLIDTHVAESLLPRFRERDWHWQGEDEHRVPVLQERHFDLEARRVEATWTTVTKSGPVGQRTSVRIYSYRELVDLLRDAGFHRFDALVTGIGEPFVVGSPRLCLVAWK